MDLYGLIFPHSRNGTDCKSQISKARRTHTNSSLNKSRVESSSLSCFSFTTYVRGKLCAKNAVAKYHILMSGRNFFLPTYEPGVAAVKQTENRALKVISFLPLYSSKGHFVGGGGRPSERAVIFQTLKHLLAD